MYLGIVGHEAAKFTPETESRAREAIRDYIIAYGIGRGDPMDLSIVSGGCHLGGVDIWAMEEVEKSMFQHAMSIVYPAIVHRWSAPGGFKERNLAIARRSDLVLVIVVRELPQTYTGMRFSDCYHCKKHHSSRVPPHVKSGGCWTAWEAMAMGKRAEWRVIE